MGARRVRLYRLTVTRWPTEDGQPWPRYVGVGRDVPDGGAPHIDDDGLEWLAALARDEEEMMAREFGRETGRIAWDSGSVESEVYAYVLPSTGRRHYISQAQAERWARQARLLGADVTVEASEPVEWAARP